MSLIDWISKFENPVGLDRPMWFDVSYWQGPVDVNAMLAAGCNGCAVRVGVGKLYSDPYFLENYGRMAGLMYRTSYGVYVPGQDVIGQVDAWYRLHPVLDVIPRVIDLEIKDDSGAANRIAKDIWVMVDVVQKRDGVKPIIYSRKNLVDAWLVPFLGEGWLNDIWWWLAQYTWDRVREHPGEPDLPKGVKRERVILHQTADKKPTPPGVARSKSMDWDRWEIGNTQEMRLFIEQVWGGGQVVEPEPEPAEGLFYRVAVDTLNIREKPNTLADKVGTYKQGDVVECLDVGGGNAWILTGEGWCCKELTGKVYMEKVDG